MSDYYCWYQYYFAGVHKSIKSDELRYAQGHVHGVQPTAQQWEGLQASLYTNVEAAATAAHPYPGNATVLAAAEKKTRSAH